MSMSGINKQLNEMCELEKGWLYGEGEQFDKDRLMRLASLFREFYTHEAEPWLYPMLYAQVLAEWRSGDWCFSMEIELSHMKGDMLVMNTSDGRELSLALDLELSDSWKTLCHILDDPDACIEKK